MDELFPLIFVPTLLFMVVVAPIWIINHYRAKGRTNASLTEDERVGARATGERRGRNARAHRNPRVDPGRRDARLAWSS